MKNKKHCNELQLYHSSCIYSVLKLRDDRNCLLCERKKKCIHEFSREVRAEINKAKLWYNTEA